MPRQPTEHALVLPAGARVTPQRRAVMNAVASSGGGFTAAELFRTARRAHSGLGLATTYRTLELLRQTGAVRVLSSGARPVYVRCHPDHHHHLVCVECGSVQETELCAAPSPGELKRRYGFAATSHEVEIYGTCSRCA